MDGNEVKSLALGLIKCENEKDVVHLLKEFSLWEEKASWQVFGQNENNFSVIGAQQNSADAALVEKIVNSVDAVLIRECFENGLNPDERDVPQTVQEALEKFFDVPEGKLSNISVNARRNLAKNIILLATGKKSNPNYCIVDRGEGQSPDRLPFTILSLSKSNKLRIPFVQGKFNMGGTGVLQFCGEKNLQFILSKRCPNIASKEPDDPSRGEWGLTLVRRENPSDGRRSSVYTYLAPKGKILRFQSETLPLIPQEDLPWGTFIKLYEYKIGSLSTAATLNLFYRLSVLLPNIALPVRVIETRDYQANTLETTLLGLNVRLEEDRNNNLEDEFPYQSSITVDGQTLNYSLYAFKEGKGENYRKDEGIIFVINGQTHGAISKRLFTRKDIGLGYIAESLLCILDCSKLDLRSREDLFMNSRDKLRDVELKRKIEKTLEEDFKENTLLKKLQQERRRKAIEGRIGDSKPITNVLQDLIKKSPNLSKLLLSGEKIENPFTEEESGTGEFKGTRFPTYFRLKGKEKPYSKGYAHEYESKNHV